jgi:hypothetical protein
MPSASSVKRTSGKETALLGTGFEQSGPGISMWAASHSLRSQEEADMTSGESQQVDGSDEPIDTAERPAGTVDEDANPPISDPDDDTGDGGVGNTPGD